MKARIEQLISKLEHETHIEFVGSRREVAAQIIGEWLHQYDVPKPSPADEVSAQIQSAPEPEPLDIPETLHEIQKAEEIHAPDTEREALREPANSETPRRSRGKSRPSA